MGSAPSGNPQEATRRNPNAGDGRVLGVYGLPTVGAPADSPGFEVFYSRYNTLGTGSGSERGGHAVSI